MSMIRTFIAISIPHEILSNIESVQHNLKAADCRVSWVKIQNIHLTLKFLGDTREDMIDQIIQILDSAHEGIPPFEIHIRSFGVFPNFKHPRVVWVGAESNGSILNTLVNRIEDRLLALDFQKEQRNFSGHLTLGRVKDTMGVQSLIDIIKENENYDGGKFVVNSFSLIKSVLHPQGSIYTSLCDFDLK